MATTNIIGPGATLPAAFAYDPDNPTYFLEWLSWLQLRNLQAMETAGMIAADRQETTPIALAQAEGDTLKIGVPQLPGEALRVQPWQDVNEYFVVRPNQAESDVFKVNFPTYSAESPLWMQAVEALPEEFPEALWEAQNSYIRTFKDYLIDTQTMLQKKREQLPDAEDMWQKAKNELGDWANIIMGGLGTGLVGLIIKFITSGSWHMALITIACLTFVGAVYKLIKFLLATEDCITEDVLVDTALLTLPKSRENYLLRLQTISGQQMDIHNRLTEIIALENAVSQSKGGEAEKIEKGEGEGEESEPEVKQATMDDVVKALQDLAAKTEEIDLGGVRIIHSGAKLVEVQA